MPNPIPNSWDNIGEDISATASVIELNSKLTNSYLYLQSQHKYGLGC